LKPLLNEIVQADCLDAIRSIPAKSVDLLLWDPPYQVTDAGWDGKLPWEELWTEIDRVLADQGVAAINACGRFTFVLAATKPGWLRWRWFWKKSNVGNSINARVRPLSCIEEVVIFSRSAPRYRPQMRPGTGLSRQGVMGGSASLLTNVRPRETKVVRREGRMPVDLIEFKSSSSEDPRWHYHPTQKPLELARYLIRTHSEPGQTVLDLTCGSGTYPVAALLEGRNFIGVDRNEGVEIIRRQPPPREFAEPVRDGPDGRTVFRLDCCAVARARLREAWQSLPSEQRAHVALTGLIAEWESQENDHGEGIPGSGLGSQGKRARTRRDCDDGRRARHHPRLRRPARLSRAAGSDSSEPLQERLGGLRGAAARRPGASDVSATPALRRGARVGRRGGQRRTA